MNVNEREFGAKMLAALGNGSRLHIVEYLSLGPAPVRDIGEAIGMKQSITSQHLAILQNAGIVVCRPEGQLRYYSLRGTRITQILQLIEEFYEFHRENLRLLWEDTSE